jgi:hypothetical protein
MPAFRAASFNVGFMLCLHGILTPDRSTESTASVPLIESSTVRSSCLHFTFQDRAFWQVNTAP